MYGAKVCGKPVKVSLYEEKSQRKRNTTSGYSHVKKKDNGKKKTRKYLRFLFTNGVRTS